MYLTLLVLPLLSGMTVGLLGRKIGVNGSYIISLTGILITTILGYISFYEVVLLNSPVSIKLTSWIESEIISINWGFNFDELTVSMMIPVLTISLLVQAYSIIYMKDDPHNQRFFSYLSLFTFFMLLLVSGDNYLILFIGWEGVGVLSFLLISFWFTRVQATKSATSAILFNRVGDLFFILGQIILLTTVGSLNFSVVFSMAPYLNKTILLLVGISFIIAAMGKSAQLGLHIWLPQAMEGPTPVSALIHAATMVTAGVYLMMRSSPLLEYNSDVLYLISWLGGITALISSLIGLFQNDLKRIIAYSTCSQLGMMFVSIGISQYNIALFHLINHAFFKALLFLSAGVIIHALNDEQDIRKMGGIISWMPLTYTFVFIGSLSLMAIPFLTGYYSKDLIIEMTLSKGVTSEWLLYWLLTFVAVLTSSYSFKIIYYAFLSKPSANKKSYEMLHDVPFSMLLPLIILCICSIIWGYLTKELFIGIGTSALGNSLFSSKESYILDIEFGISVFYKLLPFFLSILIVILLFNLLHNYPFLLLKLKYSNIGNNVYKMFNQRCWLDLLYTNKIVSKGLELGYYTSRYLDKGVLEWIGPWGLLIGFNNLNKVLVKADSGILRHYAIYICLGFLSIITLASISLDYKLIVVMLVTTILVITSSST